VGLAREGEEIVKREMAEPVARKEDGYRGPMVLYFVRQINGKMNGQ